MGRWTVARRFATPRSPAIIVQAAATVAIGRWTAMGGRSATPSFACAKRAGPTWPLQHALPPTRKPNRAVDHADHRIRLREVAPQFARSWIEVFRQEPETVAVCEQLVEKLARLGVFARARQRIHVPERACGERHRRRTEIIGGHVAEQVIAAFELAANDVERPAPAPIIRG